jgi:hypothetical protein
MKRAATVLVTSSAVALALLAPARAQADQIKFSGMHPIPASIDVEGGFCYIEVPHVHVYEPEKPEVLYRLDDGHYHFVGDPVGFGYEGPKYAYYGHHPVSVNASVHLDVGEPAVEYCYIDGPHYHDYEPPPELHFTVKGGAYWYIGKFPRAYHKHKKRLHQINVVYEPIEYERPVIVVDAPPPGYHGPVVDVDVDVHAPAPPQVHADVEVHVPVPTLDVHVDVPGVEVRDHRHHHHRHEKHKHYKKHKGGWR